MSHFDGRRYVVCAEWAICRGCGELADVREGFCLECIPAEVQERILRQIQIAERVEVRS